MQEQYKDPVNLSDVENEDHKAVIKRMTVEESREYGVVIRQMKNNQIEQDLKALEAEVSSKGDAYVPIEADLRLLRDGKEHPDTGVHKLCQTVLAQIDAVLRKDMAAKYNMQTPAKHVSDLEKRFLRKLRVKGEHDRNFSPVIVRLCWLCAEESLDERMQQFRSNPSDVEINSGEHGKYKFFLSGPVPLRLKQKARTFLTALEQAGKVRRPQPRRRVYYEVDDYDYDYNFY